MKNEAKVNEYEVKGNVVYLKLKKKDGSTIDAKIDADDLQMVLDGGTWFAEWHKDFNSYLAKHYIDGPKHKEKQTLHSFILAADSKEPIRHLNGDTLDNRKSNLEIYNKNTPNDYRELDAETAAVILRDNYGRENGRTIIDKEDLDKVIGNGYTWVYYRSDKKPYAVANTPSGRIYLNNFVMDATDNITTHHINLNTLDNRKSNLKSTELVKEPEEQDDL
jgi:hypothetical protein